MSTLRTEISMSGDAQPTLNALAASVSGDRISRRAGVAAMKTLREHFKSRPDNAKGWPSQGFWNTIAQATHLGYVDAAGADIAITHPAIFQKLHGGTITPKRGKYLAIPAMPEAAAAGSPREGATPELMFYLAPHPAGGDRPALAAFTQGTKQIKDRRKGHAGQMRTVPDKKKPVGIWYWLVRSVTQQPDPDTLPPGDVMGDAILDELNAFLDEVITGIGSKA